MAARTASNPTSMILECLVWGVSIPAAFGASARSDRDRVEDWPSARHPPDTGVDRTCLSSHLPRRSHVATRARYIHDQGPLHSASLLHYTPRPMVLLKYQLVALAVASVFWGCNFSELVARGKSGPPMWWSVSATRGTWYANGRLESLGFWEGGTHIRWLYVLSAGRSLGRQSLGLLREGPQGVRLLREGQVGSTAIQRGGAPAPNPPGFLASILRGVTGS